MCNGLNKWYLADLMTVMDEVKYLLLLSKLHFETGDWQKALEELNTAKQQQLRILKRSPSEVHDMGEQRKAAAKCDQS